MIRKIIKIDKEKCNGCGKCATACHEGAIAMVNGKATLLREDFCDGFGDCLPVCPVGAITFEEREAPEYNSEAVCISKASGVCPGTAARTIERKTSGPAVRSSSTSQLMQWPCQIKLVPTNAPYFDGANLLIAADCTAYAYASLHSDFMRGSVTLIGCPKLDACDYSEKLGAIIKSNNVKSVKIVRMEVPCCGGLENAAKQALRESGKFIPWQVVTISTDGRIID